MKYLTNGNEKVKALLFDLPTSSCLSNCQKCYARKSEKRFPAVLNKRNVNLELSKSNDFCDTIKNEILKSKKNIFRLHSSGDFYSQEYINKWEIIIKDLPDIKFYSYTKSKQKLDFLKIEKLKNFNLIDSITPIGFNYGDQKYCDELTKLGYKLCPCKKEIHINCMADCRVCLKEKKICFLEH